MYDGAIAMNTAAWRRVTNQAGQAFDNLPAWLAIAVGVWQAVLIFVDQSITAGTDAPTSSATSVEVALDKVGEPWLISDFTAV
jgi:hypothetical protein